MTMHTPSDGGPVASQDAWRRPFVKQHQQWCDDFVLELRMRDVPGAVIGDHLAEVEAHCVEGGESPAEAFGPATDYARRDRKSTRLNSSHVAISYAVVCINKKITRRALT